MISFTPLNGHEKPKDVKHGRNFAKVGPVKTWRGRENENYWVQWDFKIMCQLFCVLFSVDLFLITVVQTFECLEKCQVKGPEESWRKSKLLGRSFSAWILKLAFFFVLFFNVCMCVFTIIANLSFAAPLFTVSLIYPCCFLVCPAVSLMDSFPSYQQSSIYLALLQEVAMIQMEVLYINAPK